MNKVCCCLRVMFPTGSVQIITMSLYQILNQLRGMILGTELWGKINQPWTPKSRVPLYPSLNGRGAVLDNVSPPFFS